MLKLQLFIGEQCSEVFEARTVLYLFRVATINSQNLKQSRVLFVTASGTCHACDMVALAQTILTSLLHRYVSIFTTRQVALHTQEAVALIAQIKVALNGHCFLWNEFATLRRVAAVAVP